MRILEGIVVSVKMQNTVVVEITRRTPHPLYKKLIKRSKKFLADTNGAEVSIGQKVKIIETKPMSKNKYFKVMNDAPAKKAEKAEKAQKAKPARKSIEEKTLAPKKVAIKKPRKSGEARSRSAREDKK
jgi:small subunit ribosomal protein S17